MPDPPQLPDSMLTLAEVGRRLSLHPRSVRRLIDSGVLRAYRVGEGARSTIRVDAEDVASALRLVTPKDPDTPTR